MSEPRSALFLPIFDELADPIAVSRLSAEAEEAGWDGVFVWDHQRYRAPVREIADPWVTLAAVAVATERLRIGPMITPLPRRRPVKVAHETLTLDRLSQGRLTLGVGIADDTDGELSATGEVTDPRGRADLLDESLEVLAAAWSGEPVHHRGEHYLVDDVRFGTPVQPGGIPVWVAARHGNARPLRRAARHDGVFPIGIERPEQLAELVDTIAGMRTDPGAPYDVAVGGPPGTDPRPYAEAGATWWTVWFPWDDARVDHVRGVLRDGPPV